MTSPIMGAEQSGLQGHPDARGQTFEYNRWMDDNHPGMVALRAAAQKPRPSKNPPQKFPRQPSGKLIFNLNQYRQDAGHRSISILPAWIRHKTFSSERWSYPDICMVFSNEDYQNWALARYADGTKNKEMEMLLSHFDTWLGDAAAAEPHIVGTKNLSRWERRINRYDMSDPTVSNFERKTVLSDYDRLRSYFEMMREFCGSAMYEKIRRTNGHYVVET